MFEKRPPVFDLMEDCIFWQGLCIDHTNYEILTSI